MNNISRRSFMKGLVGITAGLCAISKAEEPKYEISYDPGAKCGSKSVTKEYDLIADLVEEMNGFDKKLPDTKIIYSIHCNYTGLSFLNDTGQLEKDEDIVFEAKRWGHSHILWIPYPQWLRRDPKCSTVMMKVIVRPNLTVDIGLLSHYSTKRNIINKLENVYTLVTTRCFNVNRDEEGKIIAGLEKEQVFCKSNQLEARIKEARAKYDRIS